MRNSPESTLCFSFWSYFMSIPAMASMGSTSRSVSMRHSGSCWMAFLRPLLHEHS